MKTEQETDAARTEAGIARDAWHRWASACMVWLYDTGKDTHARAAMLGDLGLQADGPATDGAPHICRVCS